MYKALFFLIPTLCFAQINVGPAINNLNTRVTVLENKPELSFQDIVSMGFLTNELDLIAIGALNQYSNLQSIAYSNLNSRITVLETEVSKVGFRFVKPYESGLSVASNTLYTASSEPSGIVFVSPEGYNNKENRITLHLYKGSSTVTWFNNIAWVYGAEPEFQETNKTYVIQFESLDGINWRGWVEYIY